MIIFPAGYIATKYPGYFWNTNTQTLFSIKIGGELKELKKTMPNKWNDLWLFGGGKEGGYRISYKGQRKWLYIAKLKQLTETHTMFPEAK